MRRLPLVIGVVSSALWIGGGFPCLAQQQNPPQQGDTQQPAQDAAPPQKKPAAKTQTPPDSPSLQPSHPADSSSKEQSNAGHSAAEENPFPEDISRSAAEDEEDAPASASAKPASDARHATADDNPFPEDVSRSAAKADGDSAADSPAKPEPGQPGNPLPPGVSSSRSSSLTGDAGDVSGTNEDGQGTKSLEVTDAARAKRDTQVGSFYMKQGNTQGAYLRYKDAITYDATNVDAIFGLAEAARQLKKFPEAERNYQLYLEIMPNGRYAKEALKALGSPTASR